MAGCADHPPCKRSSSSKSRLVHPAGSHRFNQLQRGIPRIPRALRAGRLRALEAAGVVTSTPLPAGRGRSYVLTAAGEELRIETEKVASARIADRLMRRAPTLRGGELIFGTGS